MYKKLLILNRTVTVIQNKAMWIPENSTPPLNKERQRTTSAAVKRMTIATTLRPKSSMRKKKEKTMPISWTVAFLVFSSSITMPCLIIMPYTPNCFSIILITSSVAIPFSKLPSSLWCSLIPSMKEASVNDEIHSCNSVSFLETGKCHFSIGI